MILQSPSIPGESSSGHDLKGRQEEKGSISQLFTGSGSFSASSCSD